MPLIDEDHITQAVIASHAGAQDARLRDVMTSLVQHLHGFAREVRLTEEEWLAGLRFLTEAARAPQAVGGAGAAGDAEPELAALSEVLGLTMLVKALNQHPPARAAASGPALHAPVHSPLQAPLHAPARAPFALPASSPAGGPVHQLLRALRRDT